MTSSSRFLTGSLLLSNAAALHVVLLLLDGPKPSPANVTALLLWWGCLLITHLGLAAFLRKPRSLRAVILLECGGFLLQLALIVLFRAAPLSLLGRLGGLILWGGTYFRCHQLLFSPPRAEQLMLGFELVVAALFVTAFLFSEGVFSLTLLLLLALCCLLALAALARLRSGPRRAPRGSGGKNRLLLGALLAAPALVSALFALLLTEGMSLRLRRLAEGVRRLWQRCFAATEAFMYWLASLLPESGQDLAEPPGGAGLSGGEAVPGEAVFFDSRAILVAALLCVILAALAVLCVCLIRGGRGKVISAVTVSRPALRRRTSLPELLRLLLARLNAALSRLTAYVRGYHTAPGLFLWLERRLRRRRRGRLPGETPRAFLLRAADLAPDCRSDLLRLADHLDEHYFGPGGTLSAAEVKSLRRRLRSALRR